MKTLFFARDPGGARFIEKLIGLWGESENVIVFGKDYALPILRGWNAQPIDFEPTPEGARGWIEAQRKLHGDFVLITGTSNWDDSTERSLWQACAASGARCAAALDLPHRVRERFTNAQGELLPLPTAVISPHISCHEALRALGFSSGDIFDIGFIQLPGATSSASQASGYFSQLESPVIAFASEPQGKMKSLGLDFPDSGYDVQRAIQDWLETRSQFRSRKGTWILKRHPKEDRSPSIPGLHVLGSEVSPQEILANVDLWVGLKSVLLLEAMSAGKPVLCMNYCNAIQDRDINLQLFGEPNCVNSKEALVGAIESFLDGKHKAVKPDLSPEDAQAALRALKLRLISP